MSTFRARVAALLGVPEARLERLAGGDLSEVLIVRRPDGRCTIAKGGPGIASEAAMLRAIAAAGLPVPAIEGEHADILLLAYVRNDAVLSASAWTAIGAALARLHARRSDLYGWPVDYQIGTIDLPNRQRRDWPGFWGEQRLMSTAAILDRPWRERVERLARRLPDLLPTAPPAALLHGDLWSGNLLVESGKLAAFIDPACYHGDAEVDLAMLALLDAPPDSFWDAYGAPEPGWRERQSLYQLFPALARLRLFGPAYAGMVDRLLKPFD